MRDPLRSLASENFPKISSICLRVQNEQEHSGKKSFPKNLWFAFVVVFVAEMGRIPCCGRAESSSSNI